jgi:plastocyanin
LRRGVSSKIFFGTVLVLLLAALSEGLYVYTVVNQESNNNNNNLSSLVPQLVSPTTITQTIESTATSTQTVFTSGNVAISYQTVTVTSTTPGYKTGLFFNTTLIIIPKGIAQNQSLNFVPSNVRVKIGVNNSVTWINQDNLSQHTIVTDVVPAGGNQIDLILGTNQTYTVKFTAPGIYHYYCMWHPGWMKGTITVLS